MCSCYLSLLNSHLILNPSASLTHNWNNSCKSFADLSCCQMQDILQTFTCYMLLLSSFQALSAHGHYTCQCSVNRERFSKHSNRLAILWRQDILRTYKRHDEWFILALFGLSIMVVVRHNRILQGLKGQAKELSGIVYISHKKPFHVS